jgi:hypothetical protein
MIATEKLYHIYAKDKCLFHSLKEEEFQITWSTLRRLIDMLDTKYADDDLTYEELYVNKEAILNSSH